MSTQAPTTEAAAAPVTDMDVFVSNAKAIMDRKRWNMTDLAAKSGISNAMLSQIFRRNDNCTFQTARRIADALSVPLWKLLRPRKSR